MNKEFWHGRRVLLTGHTGFKGSLLTLWLQRLGAEVTGLSLDPATTPSLFVSARVAEGIGDLRGDIADAAIVARAMELARPSVVFHLAAQALVRASYKDPVQTFATNVMGTVNVLEAVRGSRSTRAVVVVTSDKCYANDGSGRAHSESDSLGGFDPYSSSKACAELVSASYRNSFLASTGIGLATVRAGNVIGGGDWAQDRLVPDAVRAWSRGQPVLLRNPRATRPWQHAFAPLSGCVALAQSLVVDPVMFSKAWNFGPPQGANRSVAEIVELAAAAWGPEARWQLERGEHPHEAPVLALDSSQAVRELNFQNPWPLERTMTQTIHWYRRHLSNADMRQETLAQIESYANDLHN